MDATATTVSTGPRFAGGLSRRQFLAITCLFWVYVALSNILYAWSMRGGMAHMTNAPLFAPWDVRLAQHALLLPILIVSYWASLRVEWRPLWVALPLQLVLATVFAAMAYPAMIIAQLTFGGHHMHGGMNDMSEPWSDPTVMALWLASFVSSLPAYGFGLALITGLALYTRFRNSELRLSALEREWSAARLAALRMQLSPHTLFNLLHTIRGQIDWDPKDAQSMVVQLADLLRRLLNAGEREYSRLGDELQFVRLYLELQQRRFPDRLRVNLPAPASVPVVWVPSLILQPLVENAVVHGLAGHQGMVDVTIAVQADERSLIVTLRNTVAAQRSSGWPGIGLKNVRERLALQFEDRASLRAEAAEGEWISEIVLPAMRDSPLREARHAPVLAEA